MLSHALRAVSGKTNIDYISGTAATTTTASTTLTINKPTGTIEGDLMIAIMVADEGRSWTGDTGWTEVLDSGIRIAYKVAGASEPSSYTFTIDASRRSNGAILTYRNAVYDTVGSVDTSSPYSPSGITMSSSGRLIGVIAKTDLNFVTFTLPTTMTTRVYATLNVPRIAIGDEVVYSGATGSRTFTSSSSTSVRAVLLGIKVK